MFESLGRVGSLRRGILGVRETFALSLALLALVMASSLATSGAAALAGGAVPLVYALAGHGSLCLASVIIRFTRRMASAGGLYTFTSRGLDRNAGFVGGWLYSWGFAAGVSFVLVIASVYLSTVLTVHTSIDLSWFQCFWILLALLTAMSLVDIRLSTRVQLIVAALGVLLIVILALTILGKGGDSGVTLQPFNPSQAHSAHDYFMAMVFAFTGFIGFEAAAALGEESSEPLKMIPKAILSAVIVAVVFYVFVTWAMSVGFGVANAGKWAGDPAALDTLATRYVGSWFATLVDVAVVVDAFVAALAGAALVSRTAFAMGREGGLPRAFAWTHPRFKTPWVSILATMALTLVLVSWLARGTWNNAFTYFAFMATTATFGILGAYILTALAGMAYFWRMRVASAIAYNPLWDAVVRLGAIVIDGRKV
jgi:amino acid transporter